MLLQDFILRVITSLLKNYTKKLAKFYIINDQLSALGACLKSKAFGWALV